MTPDTASSSAAMRADVPTDRPRARWEREGWGGIRVTSMRQGETTLVNFPCESIYIHFATVSPNLINDVKAMTQQSLRPQRQPLHANASSAEGEGLISLAWAIWNKHTSQEKPYCDCDLFRTSVVELSAAPLYKEQICKAESKETLEVIQIPLRC